MNPFLRFPFLYLALSTLTIVLVATSQISGTLAFWLNIVVIVLAPITFWLDYAREKRIDNYLQNMLFLYIVSVVLHSIILWKYV